MLEKARSGIYPSHAPVGYRNADGANGKRIIIPDRDTAPAVADLFERFATGKYSLDALVAELRAEGTTLHGHKLSTGTARRTLARMNRW